MMAAQHRSPAQLMHAKVDCPGLNAWSVGRHEELADDLGALGLHIMVTNMGERF